jgi:hypothetical protein
MKNCTLLKIARSGLLGLSLLVLAPSAIAQTDNSNGNARRADAADNRRDDRRDERRDDDTDWGWLGLLGLAGLLGLMPRKRPTAVVRETTVRDHDPLDRGPGGPGDRR